MIVLQHDQFQNGRTNVEIDKDVYFQRSYTGGKLELPKTEVGHKVRAELLKNPHWSDLTPAEAPREKTKRDAPPPFRPVVMKHPRAGERGVTFGRFRVSGHDGELECDDNGEVAVETSHVCDELRKIGFVTVRLAEAGEASIPEPTGEPVSGASGYVGPKRERNQ